LSLPPTLATPQSSTLFPYTTLFRSQVQEDQVRQRIALPIVIEEHKVAVLAKRPPDVSAELIEMVRRLGAPLLDVDQIVGVERLVDRKSTRLNSSHQIISYAVFCLKK